MASSTDWLWQEAAGHRSRVAGRWEEMFLSLDDLCEFLNCSRDVAIHVGMAPAPRKGEDPNEWAADIAYIYKLDPKRVRLVAKGLARPHF